MSEVEENYIWYKKCFCQELGLCKHAEGGWGPVNSDPSKVETIAQYYLDHPEYCRVGREMLVECLLVSFESLLIVEWPSQDVLDLVRRALSRAINDSYDRDALRSYWETVVFKTESREIGS